MNLVLLLNEENVYVLKLCFINSINSIDSKIVINSKTENYYMVPPPL